MITWLQDGVRVLETMKAYIRSIMQENGYKEVITPPFADVKLWQKSGHLEMYKENMFFVDVNRDGEKSNFALKPMNCPLHVEVFKHLNLSYKDLPYKISEFGFCNRYESSGSLHGLFRARGFTQDDAHVFCMEEQIEGVITNFCSILKTIYSKLGFDKIKVCLSTRPEKFAGTEQVWELAEAALAKAASASNLECSINHGDGAFYGPKLDFYIQDSRNRTWQCGTIQLDFVLPTRLGASYVDSSGNKQIPVMVHHAVLGSLERFIGVLVEHTKGRLPFWLTPKQVVILPISIQEQEYSNQVYQELKGRGFRVELDSSSQTLGYKIRHWWGEMHVPVLCILGKEEQSTKTVSLRINGAEFGNKISIESMFNKLDEMGHIN
jgi:threonyl-tRNA synthetase